MTVTPHGLDPQSLSAKGWERRLSRDQDAIVGLIPPALLALHDEVASRARKAHARSLVLSGSTARGSRTAMSDLDYHLIGNGIETTDLSAELDLHVLSGAELEARVLDGDDFIQWSLRFGRVIFDDGALLSALRLMAERRPWPNAARKQLHATKSLSFAGRVVDSGDEDGALIQVRTALSLAARAYLLAAEEFPMSRDELPGQLQLVGRVDAAQMLKACIHGAPPLEKLRDAVSEGHALVEAARAMPVRQPRQPMTA